MKVVKLKEYKVTIDTRYKRKYQKKYDAALYKGVDITFTSEQGIDAEKVDTTREQKVPLMNNLNAEEVRLKAMITNVVTNENVVINDIDDMLEEIDQDEYDELTAVVTEVVTEYEEKKKKQKKS